jgi:hypothetical protein
VALANFTLVILHVRKQRVRVCQNLLCDLPLFLVLMDFLLLGPHLSLLPPSGLYLTLFLLLSRRIHDFLVLLLLLKVRLQLAFLFLKVLNPLPLLVSFLLHLGLFLLPL